MMTEFALALVQTVLLLAAFLATIKAYLALKAYVLQRYKQQ